MSNNQIHSAAYLLIAATHAAHAAHSTFALDWGAVVAYVALALSRHGQRAIGDPGPTRHAAPRARTATRQPVPTEGEDAAPRSQDPPLTR